MNFFITIFETVSDSVFLFTVIFSTYIFIFKETPSYIKLKRRVFVAVAISCFMSILFGIYYYSLKTTLAKCIFVILNSSKYLILTAYIYRIINLKLIFISFIIQFICSTTTSSILIFLQPKAINNTQLLNIIVLFVVRLIIHSIILIIHKKFDCYNLQTMIKNVPTYIYILIFVSLFLLSGIIQTIIYDTTNLKLKILVIKLLAPILSICWAAIFISLIFNVISKKYQSDINAILKQQVDSQLYHYNQLEKINTEIRSFKHDYINHIKCIRSMLSNKEYDDLQDYLNSLSSSFPTSSFIYETGNYIADAILTEKQVNSPDDISIKFDGVIPTNIDNTDLCIILSNALDNAIEACYSCDNDKTINVYSGFKHGYFILKIKNPTVNNIADGKMATTKTDKTNHGFGLANIKRIVHKYNGYISTSCENNFFTLNITFTSLSE